jgi:hypothetical protein
MKSKEYTMKLAVLSHVLPLAAELARNKLEDIKTGIDEGLYEADENAAGLAELRRLLQDIEELQQPPAPDRRCDSRKGPTQQVHNVCQFVVTYFASDWGIDHSELPNAHCWNGYVAWIAEAGAFLDELATAAEKSGAAIEEWYDVLDECAGHVAQWIKRERREPDLEALRPLFTTSIQRHSEQ